MLNATVHHNNQMQTFKTLLLVLGIITLVSLFSYLVILMLPGGAYFTDIIINNLLPAIPVLLIGVMILGITRTIWCQLVRWTIKPGGTYWILFIFKIIFFIIAFLF